MPVVLFLGLGSCLLWVVLVGLSGSFGPDVASESRPVLATLGSFGLGTTACIGCGGCIDVCPVDGISFKPLRTLVGVGQGA